MKTITSIAIAIFAATFTFASNGNPTKNATVTPATTTTTAAAVKVANTDATTEMSAAMDAVLGSIIANNTLAITATTIDDATILSITSDEITVSNLFLLHEFNETFSDDIEPVAPAMEVITLDAEEL